MKSSIKATLPSLATLMLGMLVFILLATTLPVFTFSVVIAKYVFSSLAIALIYFISKVFLKFENIDLSIVHLIPAKDTWVRLIIGLMIGAVITGVMLIALFNLTGLGLERVETQTLLPFVISALVFIPLAFMEELLFRGYPFFRLTQIINIRWVILITAILFTLYHYNGSQNLWSLFIGPGIWGVTYGVAAYISKSIAVPLGIHISANVLQALFGLKSGYDPMWKVIDNQELLTQMNHDHLGIIMQIILLVCSVIVLELALKTKKQN